MSSDAKPIIGSPPAGFEDFVSGYFYRVTDWWGASVYCSLPLFFIQNFALDPKAKNEKGGEKL